MVQDSRPDGQEPGSPAKFPLPIIGALGGAIIVGILLVVVAFGGGGDDGDSNAANDGESGGLAPTSQPTVEATIDLARPTVVGDHNLDSVSADDRIVITKFGVDAPLTHRTVGLDGRMPNPEGPDDVAYYDFSAWPGKGGAPGLGGNAVFAGHVDSGLKACKNGSVQPPCQAVFWDISQLRVGDEVELHVGGTVHRYRVATNEPVSATNGPWDQIVSSTAEESITLITCGGDFNRETREYSNRQVVTAVRI
jgi:LPXTG-site transpeptidase (sortase) family protein